mgnify:CR=1 FL=1
MRVAIKTNPETAALADTLSKKMVRKVKNRWGDEIWPWDREGFKRPSNRFAH